MTGKSLLVGYDASAAAYPMATGIGRYTRELLEALLRVADPDIRFLVFVNSLRHAQQARRWRALGEAENARLVVRRLPGPLLLRGWRTLGRPTWEGLTGEKCDVLHAPAMYLPPSACPRVATVHDLGFLREENPAREGGAWFRRTFPRDLPRCARVVTPSAFVADDVRRTYGLANGRVIPVHSGLSPAFLAGPSPEPCTRARWDVLGVTALVERKRPRLLAETFRRLARESPGLRLAVLGWDNTPHLFPEGTEIFPRLPDRDVAALYRASGVTVLTTREEGFGFPLLESLACGTPVVCARHSSLAEVGGGFADFVEGDTAEAFATRIRDVLRRRHDSTRQARARQHARTFRWEVTARRMLRVYREAAGEN